MWGPTRGRLFSLVYKSDADALEMTGCDGAVGAGHHNYPMYAPISASSLTGEDKDNNNNSSHFGVRHASLYIFYFKLQDRNGHKSTSRSSMPVFAVKFETQKLFYNPVKALPSCKSSVFTAL